MNLMTTTKQKWIEGGNMDFIMKIVSGFLFGFGGTFGYWFAKVILRLFHTQV
jgi:hypothetical protein